MSLASTPTLFAAIAALAISSPVIALPGGIVLPPEFVQTFDQSCGSSGPNFSTSIPKLANNKHWDEFGRKAGAKGRVWMIAVNGSPVIIDISDPNPGHESCAISATSDPVAIQALLTKKLGRKPDNTDVGQQQFGNTIAFRYTKVWTVGSGPSAKTYNLINYTGRREARLSIRYGK